MKRAREEEGEAGEATGDVNPELAAEIARKAFAPPWGLTAAGEEKAIDGPDRQRVFPRFRMIQYVKNSIGYQNYISKVPRESRREGDPQTPDPTDVKLEKRRWDRRVAHWRKSLLPYIPEQCRTLFKTQTEMTDEDRRLHQSALSYGTPFSVRIVRLRTDVPVEDITCGIYQNANPELAHTVESAIGGPHADPNMVGGENDGEPSAKRARREGSKPLSEEQRAELHQRFAADARL